MTHFERNGAPAKCIVGRNINHSIKTHSALQENISWQKMRSFHFRRTLRCAFLSVLAAAVAGGTCDNKAGSSSSQ